MLAANPSSPPFSRSPSCLMLRACSGSVLLPLQHVHYERSQPGKFEPGIHIFLDDIESKVVRAAEAPDGECKQHSRFQIACLNPQQDGGNDSDEQKQDSLHPHGLRALQISHMPMFSGLVCAGNRFLEKWRRRLITHAVGVKPDAFSTFLQGCFADWDARMNIGISTTMIQRGKSGVAQYVFALVRALLAEPGKHHLMLFVLEDDLPLFAFVEDRARIIPVPESCRPAIKNILWHQTRLPWLARQLQLDVLHVPSYRRLLWSKPCALVATIHDLAPFHVKGKYDPARMFYGRVVVRHLAKRQDAIIAISSNTAGDIERFLGIPRSRQCVILNGIDHSRFYPGESYSARKQACDRWNLREPFFLYISRLEHPAKNHVRLIEAFTRFKQATGSPWLLVLGGSDWHGAESIHSAARVSPVAKDIRFLGFVDDKDLPTLYRAAQAFVYPSLFEGFGLPPVEAMACGCPVISSTRGALQEVVRGSAAVVDPESVDDLAGKLQQVASQEAYRHELAQRGLANARRFAWDANARAVLEVYSLLLKKGSVV